MSTIETKTRKVKTPPIPVIETVSCYICQNEFPKDDCTEFDEHYLCDDCLQNETFICDRCNDRFWNDENAGDGDTPLCESCYDHSYTRCEACSAVIHTDDAYYLEDDDDSEYPYCSYCHERQETQNYIHGYSFKPTPIFHGDSTTNRYFGVELEVDEGGQNQNKAHSVILIANREEENIYIKTDGSLHDGFEIVTHPMTLQYHMNKMPWEQLTEKALDLSYKSHKTETCGLHIHVNRNTFSDDYSMQEKSISRVLFIVERFWEELLRFSRRTESQIRQWAARYGFASEPHKILDTAKKNGYNRYTCVNITNTSTIEFRIFRGTLKTNTIKATIQLVDYICTVAFSMGDNTLEKLDWCSFVEIIDQYKYPELIQYLKERRLYINEEINSEEEE